MTITVPEELGQRLTAIAAKKGEGVHNFAVAVLERTADEAQAFPSSNGTQGHAPTSEPEEFDPEDFGLKPVVDTPKQAILRAKLMARVGKLRSGGKIDFSEGSGNSFTDYLVEKRRQGDYNANRRRDAPTFGLIFGVSSRLL